MGKMNTSKGVPGVKIHYSFLKILTGSDLSRKRLPCMSAVSDKKGPVVWLTACIHGDEIAGVVIIQEIFRKIRRRLLCGELHAFPIMNPTGFETGSRNITVSSEDLNRSFPGDPEGSPGKRIAGIIFNTIMDTSPDLVLDLHNDWNKSIPYVLLDRNLESFPAGVHAMSRNLAVATGFLIVEDTDIMTGTLSCNLLMKGVPSLTFELGEPNRINEKNVAAGVGALWNILAHMGMVAGVNDTVIYDLPPVYSRGMVLRYSERPYSSKSGIIRFISEPGDVVKKGQPFARIVNAFGKNLQTVHALDDAIVLGHTDSSVVFPGMPITAFGMLG